ncbi:unnamed protein product [Lepeophtheirus salmonis]|uniref:(salmon louse) hypothetical protein n=1 Tax=Lepeophtheirus salmonis TaxID=72036 RepID=A0A7R8CLA4_LEPSM|nr:unnamed protein product [Lepeophtheirus salmonis]CAF2852359.1 unnamed protein product [Lepeophtheirus salmonis]
MEKKNYIDNIANDIKEREAKLKLGPDCLFQLVYERICKAGSRLHRNKCTFAVPDLTFLGFKVSKHGRSLNPELTRPLLEFPTPTSPSEVKSFLGLVNFNGHFLDEESERLSSIKKAITEAPCLTNYDPSMLLILSTDASPLDLGAVCMCK